MSEQLLLKIMNKLEVIGATVSSMDERLMKLEDGQKKLHVDQRDMEIKLKEIRADVGMTKVSIDYDLAKKINILFDAREAQTDVNERILAALERIETKLATQDAEIFALQTVKRSSRARKTKVE